MPRPMVPAPTIPSTFIIVGRNYGGGGSSSSTRDDRVFRNLLPIGDPLGNRKPPAIGVVLYFLRERPAHVVVIARLEAEFPVAFVLAGAGPSEDRHHPRPPTLKRPLNLRLRRPIQGKALHPVVSVRDMRFLFFKNAVDLAAPGPVGARLDVFELVSRTPVHQEIEHHEIRP